jgi:hypothetical protein
MTITERLTDIAGKYRVLVEIDNTRAIPLKYNSVVADSVALADAHVLLNGEIKQAEIVSWVSANFELISKHADLIKEVVIKLKNNPTTTLVQYNTYLGTKLWNEQAIIRFFVYKLALELAKYHGVVLTDYAENKIFLKIRDWIVATPLNKLSKVIFGEINQV